METLWKDVRFGLKTWLRSPATTLVALLTLALGIGANSAIFSVVNGVLLAPLAFPHPGQIVMVWESNPGMNLPRFTVAPANYKDWQAQSQTFESLAALRENRFNLTGGDRPEVINGAFVSSEFFPVVGLAPVLGRGFRADEDRPGSNVVVISHGLWQRRFGSDPAVLGRKLVLDGQPRAVIGVMPRGFDFYRHQDLWAPLALQLDASSRAQHDLVVIGRLKPGVRLEQARTEMTAIAGRLAGQYQDTNKGWTVGLISFADSLVEDIRPRLLLLLWAVAFVLLIACANVANLLLARVAARERELAVRAALGAGRGRLVRQMLTESVLLFVTGGALGLGVAVASLRALIALNPDGLPRAAGIGLDARVLLFTFGLSLLTGLAFGLVPALGSTGRRLHESLKEGGRSMAGGAHGRTVRGLLVLSEVAVALVLLVGAALLIRSFSRLSAVDPGFRPQGVLTAQIRLPRSKYSDAARQAVFYRSLTERLRGIPGVERVGLTFPLPLDGRDMTLVFFVRGRAMPRLNEAPHADVAVATPGAFDALSIPVLQGRRFQPADDEHGQSVAVVNKTMADEVWPGESAVGRLITFDDPRQPPVRWFTVVGVVGDVRHQGLNRESGYQVYVPLEQNTNGGEVAVLLRGAAGKDPAALARPLRDTVRQLEPDMPVDQVRPLSDIVSGALSQSRFQTVLLGLFAGLALVLAAIGVYGVVSYTVAQRTHEIGIRMALGAQRHEVLRLVIRQGMTLVLIGTAAGLALSFLLSWVLADRAAALLYKVSTTDPLTLVIVPLLLLAVALAANFLPARRATKVDPLVALRSE